METIRQYKCKDIEMLLVSKEVVISLSKNLSDLLMIKNTWSIIYVQELFTKIEYAINYYLENPDKQGFYNASLDLLDLQDRAAFDLYSFKKQIELLWEGDKKKQIEIFKALGLSNIFKLWNKGNVDSVGSLLNSFKDGMNDEIRKILQDRGMNVSLIDTILSYAGKIKAQETSQRLNLDSEGNNAQNKLVTLCNEIYNEICDICTAGAKLYPYDTARKNMFTFSKVLAKVKNEHLKLADNNLLKDTK